MMFDEKSSLTKAIGKTKKVFRTTNYGSTNGRKNAGNPVYTKQKYQKFNDDDEHYNCEADLMLDSVNRRYKKIVLTTYSMGTVMIMVGCLLVL